MIIKDWLKKLNKVFEDLFLKKAPQISKNTRELIVKIIPWLTLVFGILAIPGILSIIGLGALSTPFWVLGGVKASGLAITFIVSVVQVVLELMAVTHLFKRLMKGWNLLYWASLLGLADALLHLSGVGVIFSGLAIYLLYQIREFYK